MYQLLRTQVPDIPLHQGVPTEQDPVDEFKKEWNPTLRVKEDTLAKQLLISDKLQGLEFQL